MKNRKVVIIVSIVLIIVIIGIICFVMKNIRVENASEIPSDYKLSITLFDPVYDDPSTTVYIFDNKIIKKVVGGLGNHLNVKEISITESIKIDIEQLIEYFENSSDDISQYSYSSYNYIVELKTGDTRKVFSVDNTNDFDDETQDSLEKKIDSIFLEVSKFL